MKRILFTKLVLLLFAFSAFSQDTVKKDTAWKMGGQFNFTFSQSTFVDWAAGGDNAYSGASRLGLFANYKKENLSWENDMVLAYGKTNTKGLGIRKTDDIIELNSKFGYKASKRWNYAAVFSGKTQFDAGYKYSDIDTVPPKRVSEFMSPLDLNFALGADFKPNKHTSIFLSPLNLKNRSVMDTSFAKRNSIKEGKKSKTDLGAIIKIKYDKEIIKNINLMSKLDLFADYLRLEGFNNIDVIDVNWEVLISIKVFKVVSVNFNTNLIWDKDILFDTGLPAPNDTEPRLQYKQIFGAGLLYKF